MVPFGGMEELTELMVDPEHQGEGDRPRAARALLAGRPDARAGARSWSRPARRADLTLYPDFGVMPVTGHWHMRVRTEHYLERRAQEVDVREPGHARALARARGRPSGTGSSRTRSPTSAPRCMSSSRATGPASPRCRPAGDATGLCWVSAHGEIGPAVGGEPEDLVPVVLAALDRVAKTQEPEELSVFCTTIAWWLLRRLRGLGFRVYWPSWVMCSVPLPGLDRYVPTRPPTLL